jgi:hypothetical protein
MYLEMPTAIATPRPSISALLDAEIPGAATYWTKAAAPPWAAADEAPTTAAESRLLTIAAAAEIVPLSTKQLYRVAARRGGPFRKVEGRLMAYEDDLHHWIKSHPNGGEPVERRPGGGALAERVRRRRKDALA